MDYFGYGYGSYYGGWPYGGSEKSRHSKNRENTAKAKFDNVINQMQTAMIENTVLELRGPKSDCPLKAVPTVLMNNIFSYVFGKKYKGLEAEAEVPAVAASASAGVAAAATSSSSRGRARKKVNYSELNIDKTGNDTNIVSKEVAETGIDFNDMSIYEPGSKITIPLTKPDFHLTQPCFRDLRKHVKKNPGWDLQRVALSEDEKKAFKPKITRKSTAYYVNAVYKVPGKPKKKKRAPAKKAPAKKAPAKKRKAKAVEEEDSKPVAKKKKATKTAKKQSAK